MIVSGPLPVPKLFFQPKPCVFETDRFGLGRHIVGRSGAVGFAEGVAAGDERDGFLVVHRHAAEGVADVLRRESGSGLPSGPSGLT